VRAGQQDVAGGALDLAAGVVTFEMPDLVLRLREKEVQATLWRVRTPTAIVALKLRLREDLRRPLAAEAKKAGRSLNREIVHRLEQSFSQEALTSAVRSAVRAELITTFGQVPAGSGRPGRPIPEDKK
jgi:Arc-like DNA binding domain